MRFVLFGTGEYYNRYKIWLEKEEIVALADNAQAKQGRRIDGVLVIAPEFICRYEYDVVLIMSLYVREIKAQLLSMGINPDKIYHFYDLHDLIYQPSMKKPVCCYGKQGGTAGRKKKVLLLNQDLTLGGPALALYHGGRVLADQGYQVVYGSMIDGPLRAVLLKDGIPVVVDENMLIGTMEEADWIRDFFRDSPAGSFVICNTINFHVFLSARDGKVPVVWWLHDALFFYDGVNRRAIERISRENLKVWAVGPIAQKAVRSFRPDFQVEDLLYGVEDTAGRMRKEELRDKVCFATIGYIESRKGQDILLQAVSALEPDIRSQAVFYLVGQNTSAMAGKIMETARDIPEIIITGPVGREEIDRILEETDMLICPSREDPMPTVAAEAMMHGVPCLVSDAAGTAAYIEDGTDGMVFCCEDAGQLKGLLETCILDRERLKKMGENARRIFMDYFSMDAFRLRLTELLESTDF